MVSLKYRFSEIVNFTDFVNKVVLTTGDKIIYIYIYIYFENYLVIRGQKVTQKRKIGNCHVPILAKRHHIHYMHNFELKLQLDIYFLYIFSNFYQYLSVITAYNMHSLNEEQEKYKH